MKILAITVMTALSVGTDAAKAYDLKPGDQAVYRYVEKEEQEGVRMSVREDSIVTQTVTGLDPVTKRPIIVSETKYSVKDGARSTETEFLKGARFYYAGQDDFSECKAEVKRNPDSFELSWFNYRIPGLPRVLQTCSEDSPHTFMCCMGGEPEPWTFDGGLSQSHADIPFSLLHRSETHYSRKGSYYWREVDVRLLKVKKTK